MTTRGKLATLIAVLAFAAFLLYGTLSSQKVVCTVTVAFNGASNEATASAEIEHAAMERAQETACGTISTGMDQRIACGAVIPIRRACRAA
jgi:ABC-type nitrate/sulfonate/bicarbonate transport system ATPase subunit